jgi:hypothetical protein
MLFLDHSSVTIRLTLLDNRAVAIPIMAFANAHASAYGTNSNSNIVRQSRRRNGRMVAIIKTYFIRFYSVVNPWC